VKESYLTIITYLQVTGITSETYAEATGAAVLLSTELHEFCAVHGRDKNLTEIQRLYPCQEWDLYPNTV